MFTGIIEEIGRVSQVQDLGGGKRLTILATCAPELQVDQSISVNGACQTVVAHTAQHFSVVAVEETLRKTTLGQFQKGQPVNLERAMLPSRRLDGHLVQGHVDSTGTIVGIEKEATNWLITVRFDPAFAAYLIPVGSVALDGISLTVARLAEEMLTVAIIPYTFEHTIIHTWQPGQAVNLEFDLLGKYVARWLSVQQKTQPSGITEAWLREQGY